MATLIPNIQIEDFKKLSSEQIIRLKSSEVYDGEQYLFTFVNPQTDFIRMQAEYKAQLSNSVGGETLGQIIQVPSSVGTASPGAIPGEVSESPKPRRTRKNKRHRAKAGAK